MSTLGTSENVVRLLQRLEEILRSEGGLDWLPGIEAARSAGERRLAEGHEEGAMSEMGRIYRGMHAGPGGFDDFFVWRHSDADREAANKELNKIKDELWKLLGQ